MTAGTGVDSTMVVLASTINSFVQKNISPKIYDQVMKHNPTLYRFWRKGPKLDGGAALTWPILKGSKVNGGFYTGVQQLPHGIEDTIAPAEVLWRHVAEDVTIPRTDIIKARTPYAKVDLVKTKFDEAVINLRARMSAALFSAASEGNSYDHLEQAIDDGTNFSTYAGIAHSNSYWKPGVTGAGYKDASGAAAIADIEKLYGEASDGDLEPTLIVTTDALYRYLWGVLQALQRYTRDEEMTKIGFTALRFNRAVVIVDRNLGSGKMLFINEEFADFVSHSEENFAIDPIIAGTPSERSLNTKVVHTGNLRVKAIRYHAKMIGATNS
jgi:hypothetical protein